jgi:hypothetical protein
MSETLSHADVRNLLEGFATAIGFDQRRVDTMPLWKFDPRYDEDMWRQWRTGHIRQINKILQSVDEIPSSMLAELAALSTSYKPETVRNTLLELFAEVVSGSVPEEEFEAAERFFGWLICYIRKMPADGHLASQARTSNLTWWSFNDPLTIALDPEVGYRLPSQVSDN